MAQSCILPIHKNFVADKKNFVVAGVGHRMKGKEESKVAVTVTNVSPCKRKFSDEKEYRMNKFSRVTKAKNLAYQWKEPERRCENYIKEILDSKGDSDIVRLKAKVLKKSEATTVYSRLMKRDLKKCDLVVADCSGAMEINLWEEYIDQVTVDSSYCFYEMVVNSFNRKQLNSNRASMISKCDDVVISEEVSDMAGRIGSDEGGSESLRIRPRVHQAGLLHAISPISMKLGQFKGSTPKLQKTNWFLFWIFLGGDRRPPLVLLYFYQGKCYNIRQK